jgi:hypothetical protein
MLKTVMAFALAGIHFLALAWFVYSCTLTTLQSLNYCTGSISLSCPYWGHVHSPEGKNGLAIAPV